MNSKLSRRVIARALAARLIEEPARRQHWVKVLAAYLVEQNRMEEIDLVVADIAYELKLQGGHVLVDVTTARPLQDSVREALKHDLKEAAQAKHIELAEHTDPDLLGGLVARTPDGIMDLSVRTQLKQLAAIK